MIRLSNDMLYKKNKGTSNRAFFSNVNGIKRLRTRHVIFISDVKFAQGLGPVCLKATMPSDYLI